jgi:hypothetical protein
MQCLTVGHLISIQDAGVLQVPVASGCLEVITHLSPSSHLVPAMPPHRFVLSSASAFAGLAAASFAGPSSIASEAHAAIPRQKKAPTTSTVKEDEQRIRGLQTNSLGRYGAYARESV